MSASLRAGLFAALVAFSCSAFAADKPYERAELADAAVKLEAQIKTDSGTITKTAAMLRREADAAFQKNDLRGGMQVLGQLVTTAPNEWPWAISGSPVRSLSTSSVSVSARSELSAMEPKSPRGPGLRPWPN